MLGRSYQALVPRGVKVRAGIEQLALQLEVARERERVVRLGFEETVGEAQRALLRQEKSAKGVRQEMDHQHLQQRPNKGVGVDNVDMLI